MPGIVESVNRKLGCGDGERSRYRGGTGHAKLPKARATLTDWMLSGNFRSEPRIGCHALISELLCFRLTNDWMKRAGIASATPY